MVEYNKLRDHLTKRILDVQKSSALGDLKKTMKEVKAIILLCPENLQQLLKNRENVELQVGRKTFNVDCGELKDFIEQKSDNRKKFIACACEVHHIPRELRSDWIYLYKRQVDYDELSRQVYNYINTQLN